ncbi:glycosyltransferase family 2 protein [Enterocloster bolteae]|uniref:glycosyltransferase family 2 protein n=1 Tax=Enterocloster bolteae TaxID=208479 RepID=UPI002A81164D|nr:glycosyltransferase family 2 protein [Enterocloster bolteae]
MIKVSVVIPIYNMEKYLRECLDSIFRQTLHEIEVICVDDGSNDASLRIVKEYKKIHSNLIIITQKNSGSGMARNAGLKNASGQFVMFIDPDDYLASADALEVSYKCAIKEKVEVCGGSVLGDKNGIIIKNFQTRFMKHRFSKDGRLSFIDYQYPFAHQRFIIKKELLISNNILYPPYQRGQDVVFLAKVLICAGTFYALKKDIYIYRSGHKEVVYTANKAIDYLHAMCDVLEISIKNELKQMFIQIAGEINYFAKMHWYKMYSETDIWDKNLKINQLLDRGSECFNCHDQIELLMDKVQYRKYCESANKDWDYIEQLLDANADLVIYGAGLWGEKIYQKLKNKEYKPKYFVVSDKSENKSEIDGIKVVSIDELHNREKFFYILGMTDSEEVKVSLIKKGCPHILEINPAAFNEDN